MEKLPIILETLKGEYENLEMRQIGDAVVNSTTLPNCTSGKSLALKQLVDEAKAGHIFSADAMSKIAAKAGYNATSYAYCASILVAAGVVKFLGKNKGWQRL